MNQHRAPRILIADDDPGLMRFLATRCSKMGFEVQTAANGLQALLAARRTPPDIMIADINMPEIDGLSVALRLLSQPDARLDIILISASNFRETPGRCESLGVFYVAKGLDLWKGVRTALEKILPNFMSEANEEVSRSVSTAETSRNPRILLVDDDPSRGVLIQSRLKKLGVDLVLASDRVRALHYATSETPALIISNYAIPDCDPHYLLMKLRAAGSTRRVPVVILSDAALDAPTKARFSGYAPESESPLHYLVKPFDNDVLFSLIQKYCAFRINPSLREERLYTPAKAAGA